MSGGQPTPPPRSAENSPDRTWTVLALLKWTTDHFAKQGIETARLDAECLLAHALGSDRLRLYLDFEKPVLPDERAVYRELVRRRASERVPVALLLGEKEFWSLSLRVGPGVLVPRPETETLVSRALERSRTRTGPGGCSTWAPAAARLRWQLPTKGPPRDHGHGRLRKKPSKSRRRMPKRAGWPSESASSRATCFDPVRGERFDLVVSNPPYVAEASRPPRCRRSSPTSRSGRSSPARRGSTCCGG